MPQEASSHKRILVFPYSHTLSHVSRPLVLAEELRNRNYEIIFAGENPSSFIAEKGFEMIPVYEPDPRQLFGNIRKGNLRFVSDDEVDKMIEADLELYGKVKPDLVLSDGRFTAPISTCMAGMQHAAIVNVSSTEFRSNPYVPFFDWIPGSVVKRETPLWKAMDRLNLRMEMAIFDRAMGIFSRRSRKLGMLKRITATNCLTGKDLTLLADIPEYFPTRNLPPDYHYIGPLTLKTGMKPPSWWPLQKRRSRLIYMTMGTTGIGDFFHKAGDLVRNTDLIFVVTTGGQVEDLKSIEGSIYFEKYMNGDLVMESADLVVCHGGNGTIYQALQHGKPIVGIPTIPDQRFNMRRVESLGVGVTVQWSNFMREPDALLKAIDRALQNCSQNARHMKSIVNKYDGARNGADRIEQLLQA